MKLKILALFCMMTLSLCGEEQITFAPPSGWGLADQKLLPEKVKVMVIGPTQSHYPPSINLGYEPYLGTMDQYLVTVKKINQTLKAEYRDLGNLETKAGLGRLCQIDTPSEWGDVRMLHLFLIHDKTMIVLTTAALKSEFALYYQDFFNSLKSLQIIKH